MRWWRLNGLCFWGHKRRAVAPGFLPYCVKPNWASPWSQKWTENGTNKTLEPVYTNGIGPWLLKDHGISLFGDTIEKSMDYSPDLFWGHKFLVWIQIFAATFLKPTFQGPSQKKLPQFQLAISKTRSCAVPCRIFIHCICYGMWSKVPSCKPKAWGGGWKIFN